MVANDDYEARQESDKKRHYVLMTVMLMILCLAGGAVAYAILDSRSVKTSEMLTQVQGAEGIGEVKALPEFMNDKTDKNDLESLKP